MSQAIVPLVTIKGPAAQLPTLVYPSTNIVEDQWTITATLAGMRALWGCAKPAEYLYDTPHWLANVKLAQDSYWRWNRWTNSIVNPE